MDIYVLIMNVNVLTAARTVRKLRKEDIIGTRLGKLVAPAGDYVKVLYKKSKVLFLARHVYSETYLVISISRLFF